MDGSEFPNTVSGQTQPGHQSAMPAGTPVIPQPGMYKYNTSAFHIDGKEIMKRGFKYLLEGLAVAFVAYYFTRGKLNLKEIVMLGITAAFVFAILDTFSPTVSLGVRFGAGFGIGQTMFGVAPGSLAGAAPVVV